LGINWNALKMNVKSDAPAASSPPAVKRPAIGDVVHYYDENRVGTYPGTPQSRGVGPYAGMVVDYDPGGLALDVRGRHGGFFAERVPHKRELPRGDDGQLLPGKKRWWLHKHESDK
jgi:hypothetical protein